MAFGAQLPLLPGFLPATGLYPGQQWLVCFAGSFLALPLPVELGLLERAVVADFFGDAFFVELFFAGAFFAVDFFVAVFFAEVFFVADFFADVFVAVAMKR